MLKPRHLFLFGTAAMLTAAIFSVKPPLPVLAAEASVSVNEDQLSTLLEEANFTVQQGTFYELDTIKEASEGRLMSCFGNNAGSAYTVFSLPAASDQEVPNPKFLPLGWQYKLRQD